MAPVIDLLTTRELATYLKKPVPTIHAWRRRRVGPPGFRLGRDVVYRRSAVDEWLRELEAADQEVASLATGCRVSCTTVTAHENDNAPGVEPGAPVEQSTSTSTSQ